MDQDAADYILLYFVLYLYELYNVIDCIFLISHCSELTAQHLYLCCQGSLQFFGGHTCGCVLLTADYVLTAAHCTDGRDGTP